MDAGVASLSADIANKVQDLLDQARAEAYASISEKLEEANQKNTDLANEVFKLKANCSPRRQPAIVVPETYDTLQTTIADLRKQLTLSEERCRHFQRRAFKYREMRNRDRAAIKSWQDYHDTLVKKSGDAHRDVEAFVQAVTAHPVDSLQKSAVEGSSLSALSSVSPRPGTGKGSQRPVEHQREEALDVNQHLGHILVGSGALMDREGSPDLRSRDLLPNIRQAPYLSKIEVSRQYLYLSGVSATSGGVIKSSQSTEGDSETGDLSRLHHMAANLSTDEPEITYMRSLKRKRLPLQNALATGNESASILVKDEINSSPVPCGAYTALDREDSIDLDEVPADYSTPRKTRYKERLKFASFMDPLSSLSLLREERSTSEPTTLDEVCFLSRYADGKQGVELSTSQVLKVPREKHNPSMSKQKNQPTLPSQAPQVGPKPAGRVRHAAPSSRTISPLRSLNANTSLRPRSSNPRRVKRSRGECDAVVAEFAEDGDSYSPSQAQQCAAPKSNSNEQLLSVPVVKSRRLNELLETPLSPASILAPVLEVSAAAAGHFLKQDVRTQSSSALCATKSIGEGIVADDKDSSKLFDVVTSSVAAPGQGLVRRGGTQPFSASTLLLAKQRLDRLETVAGLAPTPRNASTTNVEVTAKWDSSSHPRVHSVKSSEHGNVLFTSAAKGKKKRGPRRSLPAEELRLDDFRVNPNGNFGCDFAYEEVRRGRERACLPGCTRPECCGNKFKKLAQLVRVNSPTRGLWEPTSSQDQETSDQRLLREYMGYDDGLIASMTDEAKQEALLSAKARALAGEYGRHKEQWARNASPPGFWRTGFPSTQELEKDRVESERRTREQVEQRRREALRKDGQWTFIDE